VETDERYKKASDSGLLGCFCMAVLASPDGADTADIAFRNPDTGEDECVRHNRKLECCVHLPLISIKLCRYPCKAYLEEFATAQAMGTVAVLAVVIVNNVGSLDYVLILQL